jgi:hypothetical protein
MTTNATPDAAVKESTETVDIFAEPTAPEAVVAPSRADMKEKGWSAKELDSAEKLGLIAPKVEVKKEEIAPKVDEKPAAPVPVPAAKNNGSLPDFTMTPEQEELFLKTFGPGAAPRAMYFRMKNERQARQKEASEKNALAAELAAIKAQIARPQTTQQVDENGNVIDPENQPLTIRALKELQKAEAEEYNRRNAEQNERAQVVANAQVEQEEYARSLYSDFDDTVNRAKEVMQNLETLVPEKWKQTKVVKLVRELQTAAANADKIGLDEYHAALIAYEIGQMHPDHGQAPKAADQTGTPKDPKDGALSPEQMKRIEANTLRRSPSAAVSAGGGKRTISVEDIDLATLNKMDSKARMAFKEKHPERYGRLLRG